MNTVIIGDRPTKEITQEDVLELVIMIGCCASLQYFHRPVITDFDNKMFSDTVVLEYHSFRISDNMKGSSIKFFFNFNELSYHYTRDSNFDTDHRGRLRLPEIKYLIDEGYDIPLY